MAEHYEHIDKTLCNELEKLNKKYMSGVEMTDIDLTRIKDLRKALYYGEVYNAMKEESEWDEPEGEEGYSGNDRPYRRGRMGGGSYRRGRDMRTGRYISRGMDEYGYSGHYPMDYIDPMYEYRRY